MARPVWRLGQSTDPVIRARSFAAAGTLAAARWKPSEGDYGDALASIVKAAGPGLISWQDPASSEIYSTTPLDETGLAEAWNRAFPVVTGGNNPIARISIDTQSFGQTGSALQSEILATYRRLLNPWLNKLDDRDPGQIAALSFTAFDQASTHDWNWPLRVGLAEPGHGLSEMLNLTRRASRDFMDVVSPAASASTTDVVLVSGLDISALAQPHEMNAGLTIVYPGEDTPASMIDQVVAGKITMPTAVIGVSQKSIPKFLNEFTDEIAHNKPLDVALFDAYRTIYNPKGDRGSKLNPLVLLAPRKNVDDVFEGIKLENRVKELAGRLDQMSSRIVVGVPPRSADALGIERTARTVGDYLAGMSQAIEGGTLDFSRESRGAKALRSTTKAIEGLEVQLRPPVPSPYAAPAPKADAETSAAAEPRPFSAYPRLDAPDEVRREIDFDTEVGFSDVPDPRADAQQKIDIADAENDEELLVIVSAENGHVREPNHAWLKLKLDAAAKFTVRPAPDADFVRISAEYFRGINLVGSIVRTLAVAGRPRPEPDDPAIDELFWPVMRNIDYKSLDLVLLVKRESSSRITWQAVAGKERVSARCPVDVEDTKQFAAQLDSEQRALGYSGFASHETIRVVGQTIAELIPQKIQDEYLAPCLKGSNAAPRILIVTNEPYIPWELALLEPTVTGKDDLQYFGAVARIGRWWTARRVDAPVPNLTVGRISVVCAESYEVATGRRDLPEAIAERNWLEDRFKANRVDGIFPRVIDWIKSLPIGPGHLAHFALHGYSNPLANEQALILGDGQNVTPAVLSGVRLTNKDPRYGMVFLNACQVGIAGTTLGQFAGFPGTLLQAGTNAVIGPIWEVNDAAAHKLVVKFYEDTLQDKRVPVSEALRQLRANCDKDATTTPLAYIFYGHPDLTLQR